MLEKKMYDLNTGFRVLKQYSKNFKKPCKKIIIH